MQCVKAVRIENGQQDAANASHDATEQCEPRECFLPFGLVMNGIYPVASVVGGEDRADVGDGCDGTAGYEEGFQGVGANI